jgi:aerobic-type carbon monoxide dehydrogenase small subunit (CoxS/CutS family)
MELPSNKLIDFLLFISNIHESPLQFWRICCFCIVFIDLEKYHSTFPIVHHLETRELRTSECLLTVINFGQSAFWRSKSCHVPE